MPGTANPKVRANGGLAELIDDLPESRRKLMLALIESTNINLNVTDLCAKAGISREVHYQIAGDQELRHWMAEARHLALGDLTKSIKALKDCAETPDPKCATDRQTLFKISGHLPRNGFKVDDRNEVNGTVQNLMPLGQILWLYLQAGWPIDRWKPCVRDQYETGVLKPEHPPLPELKRIGAVAELPDADDSDEAPQED
jgi:hypothetical protein